MRLHQLNIAAVALLGIQLSSSQCELFDNVKDIVLMLDGDDAGMKATHRIKMALQSREKTIFTQSFYRHGPIQTILPTMNYRQK